MICRNCGVDKESTLASIKVLLKERDALRSKVEELERERDTAWASINVLREALLTCSVGDFSTGHVMYPSFDEELVEEALAACGVVALANTPESAAKARDMLPEYYSGSCEDVAQAVDREMALRDRAEQLEADRENLLQLLESASEVIGRFVSDEGWAQSDMDMMDTIDAKIASMRRAAQ